MASGGKIPDFMKTGIGLQAILRGFICNLKGCDAGVIDKQTCEVCH
jgi:hypothetical protein